MIKCYSEFLDKIRHFLLLSTVHGLTWLWLLIVTFTLCSCITSSPSTLLGLFEHLERVLLYDLKMMSLAIFLVLVLLAWVGLLIFERVLLEIFALSLLKAATGATTSSIISLSKRSLLALATTSFLKSPFSTPLGRSLISCHIDNSL